MKLIVVAIVFVSLLTCKSRSPRPNSDLLTYSKDSQEAILELHGYYYAPLKQPNVADEVDLSTLDIQTKATLKYLFGVFQFHPPFKDSPAIPFGNAEWKTTATDEMVEVEGNRMRKINYHLKDVTLVRKTLFPDQKSAIKIQLRLPVNIKTFYELGLVESIGKDGTKIFTAPCTDPNHTFKSDFWYFWDPDREGCPKALKEQGTVAFNATFTPLQNTIETFPEYGRLGTSELLKVYVAFGTERNATDISIDPKAMAPEPIADLEQDIGVRSFTMFKQRMVSTLKYQEQAESYQRTVLTSFAKDRRIEVHTGIFKTSPKEPNPSMKSEFEDFVREAFETGDVIIYNGHSGLGGSLPTSRFFGKNSPTARTKYQVAFFNGCSTYAYYRDPYFQLKGGTKNLDIISTGLESWFDISPTVSSNLIFYLSQEKQSWQAILDNMYDVTAQLGFDVKKFSAHYSVSGDEDNPTTLLDALKTQ